MVIQYSQSTFRLVLTWCFFLPTKVHSRKYLIIRSFVDVYLIWNKGLLAG